MVKLTHLLPEFLRRGRSRSPKPLKANPSHATGVSSPSRHSPEHSLSQQGQGGPVTTAPNISNASAGQFDPHAQLVDSLVEPNSAQTPGSSSLVPPPLINPVPTSQTTDSDPLQRQDLLVVPVQSPATASQTSLLFQRSTPPPRQDGNSGKNYIQNTHESRDVYVRGDRNNVNQTTIINGSNKFMAELLEKTIPGAAFDSSARDPPPRCHPGTRLAILARCLEFIANASGAKKMRWVVGKAGVGKSAIMQSVAESPLPSVSKRVSIFFSINGRNDGTKTVMTLAFQLAAKSDPYRRFIQHETTLDPSLPQSSLSVQFRKFLVEPFILQSQLNSVGRVLIIIDGLDECDKSHTQRELLRLISDVCSTYPSSPIVWIIASRPEPHITSFFAQGHIKAVYEKEEILVDSEEARNDVEKYLRDELTKIQIEFSLNSRWPPEQKLWKLANASDGLFVFADTLIKYIGDPVNGNPTLQLNDVLNVIDAHPLPNVTKDEHPMARLDALYAHILSKVPKRVMANTQKILLALVWDSKAEEGLRKGNFLVFCNWLGMTCDDAYAAIRHLSAVLDASARDEAHKKMLRPFHKSFIDYICDFTRSGFSPDIKHEVYQLEVQCAFRILEQAPDGVDFGDMDYMLLKSYSYLARGPGTGGNISLTWPVDQEIDWNDNQTRLEMYKLAVSNVVEGIKQGESAFCTESCIRLVTSRFRFYGLASFPYRGLQSLVFERSRRHELLKHGILKQVPVKVLDFAKIIWTVRLRFRHPTSPATNLSHPWTRSCRHKRAGDWGEGKAEDWKTKFFVKGMGRAIPYKPPCHDCCIRLKRQLEHWKTRSPDHPTTILFTSADESFVEFQFVDLDDGVSEWTYWFAHEISAEERRKLGSTV